VTAGAGLLADPVQRLFGLHERKLLRLSDRLEEGLRGSERGYRLHDAYVARIFDLWDLLQSATRVLT
jgi:hypothetical protein